MKQQKGFNWFKFVTTTMMGIGVIGVGVFLFSLIFSRTVFNKKLPTSEFVPDSETSTPSQMSPRSRSGPSSHHSGHHSGKSEDQQAEIFSEADATVSEDVEMIEGEASPAETNNEEIAEPSESEAVSESQEERFFGLTRSEIEAQILVLEEEIRTNLTRAVTLYEDLISTDGMAGRSPEIAEWRDETWAEIKQLFQAARQKIPRYISYLGVTGGENPLREGGWLSELMEPLPMRVTYGTGVGSD